MRLTHYGNLLANLAYFLMFPEGVFLENPLQNLNRVTDFSQENF